MYEPSSLWAMGPMSYRLMSDGSYEPSTYERWVLWAIDLWAIGPMSERLMSDHHYEQWSLWAKWYERSSYERSSCERSSVHRFKASIFAPPLVVWTRRDLRKISATQDLEKMTCPPPQFFEGGTKLSFTLNLTPGPPHMKRFRRPWM